MEEGSFESADRCFHAAQLLREQSSTERHGRRLSVHNIKNSDIQKTDNAPVDLPNVVYFPRTPGLLENRLGGVAMALGNVAAARKYTMEAMRKLCSVPSFSEAELANVRKRAAARERKDALFACRTQRLVINGTVQQAVIN